MAPIDPQLAADAAALWGAIKATNEGAKLPIVAPVVAAVNEHVRAFAEQRLVPALQRVLPLRDAAVLAANEAAARLADVPAAQLVDPSPHVAAGIVVALQTRAGEPDLRAMFAELLANACRADRADAVHLAHVEVLRQLEPDEARVIAHVAALAAQGGPPPQRQTIAQARAQGLPLPRMVWAGAETYGGALYGLAEQAGSAAPHRAPLYMSNLERLGLVQEQPGEEGGTPAVRICFEVTPFGEAFLAACLSPLDDGPEHTAPALA